MNFVRNVRIISQLDLLNPLKHIFFYNVLKFNVCSFNILLKYIHFQTLGRSRKHYVYEGFYALPLYQKH